MKIRPGQLFGLLLLLGGVAHAEGGCPRGFEPSGMAPTPQAPVACRPIPNYQQQQVRPRPPPPQWQSQWGAIATYEPNGSFGEAVNMPSRASAEQAALAKCRAKHDARCKVQLLYRDQCAVMVVSDKGYNVNSAATIDQATQNGMQTCNNSGDPNCHVYYSACSLPARIQ